MDGLGPWTLATLNNRARRRQSRAELPAPVMAEDAFHQRAEDRRIDLAPVELRRLDEHRQVALVKVDLRRLGEQRTVDVARALKHAVAPVVTRIVEDVKE